jgi:small conductance mechanosensitive channel
VVAILGYFGVQTTTFAALIAAMALAIGSAWPTPDNVLSFSGNNKIFSDTIQNFSANPCRRVELTAQISGAPDPNLAIGRLRDRLAAIPNVAKDPASRRQHPDVQPVRPRAGRRYVPRSDVSAGGA